MAENRLLPHLEGAIPYAAAEILLGVPARSVRNRFSLLDGPAGAVNDERVAVFGHAASCAEGAGLGALDRTGSGRPTLLDGPFVRVSRRPRSDMVRSHDNSTYDSLRNEIFPDNTADDPQVVG